MWCLSTCDGLCLPVDGNHKRTDLGANKQGESLGDVPMDDLLSEFLTETSSLATLDLELVNLEQIPTIGAFKYF